MADFSTMVMGVVQGLANAAPGYRDQQQQLALTEDSKAQAKGRQLDNYEKQMQQEQQKKFQDFQARMAALAKPEDMPDPKNSDSVGDYLEKQGADYIKGGYINEGSKIIDEGIKMKSLSKNAQRAAAQDTLMQLKIKQEKNNGAAALLYGVKDQAGLDKALKGTELEGMQYTGPESVQTARGRLVDIKTQDKEREDRAKDADREQGRKIQEERAQAQQKYQKDVLALRNKELATKAGKDKAKSATAPTAQDLKDAQALLLERFPGLRNDKINETVDGKEVTSHPSLSSAAVTIAGAAKRLMAQNSALDFPTAAHSAMYKYKTSFQDIGKTTKFVGGGDSAEDPLALPKAVTEDRDPSALVKDKYYELPNGRVGVWTGTGFKFEDETPPDEEDGGEKSEWDDNTAPLEGDE